MNDSSFSFLSGVLGTDGAKVLKKAADRSPVLEVLLVPRSALSWVLQRNAYEGSIPGIQNSYLKFQKSEEGFSGVITVNDMPIDFTKASPEYIAAAIGASVGISSFSQVDIADKMLVKLGKSIDVLVQAQYLIKSIRKVELPGQTAKPLATGQPVPPTAPTKQPKQTKPKLPKPSKVPALKVEKSEGNRPCNVCSAKQFVDGKFRPCLCFRDLQKSIQVTSYKDGWVLEFDSSIDPESALAFKKLFKE